MIPWVREKFAERRARWIASRKRSESNNSNNTVVSGEGGVGGGNNSSINGNNCPGINLATPNSSNRVLIEHQKQKQKNHLTTTVTPTLPPTTTTKFKFKDDQKKSSDGDKGKEITVKIRSPTGREIFVKTLSTAKVSDIKEDAIEKFSQDSNALPLFAPNVRQLYSKYRLIRPDSNLEFSENLTIERAGISNFETLNLCIKRTNNTLDIESLRGPTITEIALETFDLRQNEPRPRRTEISDLGLQTDLHYDVRKVIISLAQSSAYIIGSGPYASRLIAMFKQKLNNKRRHQIDTLQCLVDMGFTRERASYALKLQNGIYSAALDWLIEHQNDETQPEDTVSITTLSGIKIVESNDTINNIQSLLEIVRIYSERDIIPPVETVNALVDMGFSENDVLKALRVTHNNQAAACDWLCGNRTTSLTDLRDGLSPESPILKAMMESPQVQMSLSNPKMFIAYLSMLDNHNVLSMWLADSDTSSVLSHILRKYHEEKHILGINQFNSNSR